MLLPVLILLLSAVAVARGEMRARSALAGQAERVRAAPLPEGLGPRMQALGLDAMVHAPPGTLPPSASLDADLSALRGADAVTPAGRALREARRGQLAPEVWAEPGLCGLAALELGRTGRSEALPSLLEAAAQGPSATDRLMALYAATRLAPPERWPPGAARERALTLGLGDPAAGSPGTGGGGGAE